MSGTFNDAGVSDIILIKPGEVLQYLIAMDSGDGICRVRLERSRKGDVWEIARGANGTLIDTTGTVATPITGTLFSGKLTNETGVNERYRWRCVSFSTAASDLVNWSFSNAPQAALWIDRDKGVCLIVDDETPTDGTLGDGVGYAEGGSLYVVYHKSADSNDPKVYFNNGTSVTPDWDAFA